MTNTITANQIAPIQAHLDEYSRQKDWHAQHRRLSDEAWCAAREALAAAYGIELGKTVAVYIELRNGNECRRKFVVRGIRASYGDRPPTLSGTLIKENASLGEVSVETYTFNGARWELTGELWEGGE